jgi:hypothetical protein
MSCHKQSSQSCCGTPGPRGPRGAQGVTGPAFSLNINQTFFVDARYGNDATAQPDDETKPYSTLVAANNAAIAAGVGTIYVQPGTYAAVGLPLTNNIDWFFTEGTIINGQVGPPVFYNSFGAVTVNISGYAVFNCAGPFMSLSFPGSRVQVQGTSVTVNGLNCFDFLNGDISLYVDFKTISSTGFGTIVSMDTESLVPVNVSIHTVSITTTNSAIVRIADATFGSLTINSDSIIGASPDSLFVLNSNNFILDVSGQIFQPNVPANNFSILISVPTAWPGDISKCNAQFTFQTVGTTGGLISVVGDQSEPSTENGRQPIVTFTSQYLFGVNQGAGALVNVDHGVLNMNVDFFRYFMQGAYIVTTTAAIFSLESQFTASAGGTGNFFNCDSSTVIFDSQFTFHNTQFLTSSNGGTINITGQIMYAIQDSLTPLPTFEVTAQTMINFQQLVVQSPDFVTPNGGHIVVNSSVPNTYTSSLNMYCSSFSCGGGNADAIRVAIDTSVALSGDYYECSCNGAYMVNSGSRVTIDVNTVQVNEQGGFLSLNTDAASGYYDIFRAFVNDGTFINSIGTSSGYVDELVCTTSGAPVLSFFGNVYNSLNYNTFIVNASTTAPTFSMGSGGRTYLAGNVLSVSNSLNAFNVTQDNTAFFLQTQSLVLINVNTGLAMGGGAGTNVTVTIQDCSCQLAGTGNGFANVVAGRLQLSGGRFNLSGNPSTHKFTAVGTGQIDVDVSYVTSDGPVMYINTTLPVRYAAKSTIVSGDFSIFYLMYPDVATIHDISGYMKTAGGSIVIMNDNNPLGVLRVNGGIFVANSAFIDTATNANTLNVTMQSSSTNSPPSVGAGSVVIVPAGALLVNGSVV